MLNESLNGRSVNGIFIMSLPLRGAAGRRRWAATHRPRHSAARSCRAERCARALALAPDAARLSD